jgi:hypothetical protein
VDGKLLGQGVVIDSVLSPGRRHLRVVAPGYEAHEESLEIVSGQQHPLVRVTLKHRGGSA